MKKGVIVTGIFILVLGVASSTKEIMGCISLPLTWLFHVFGTTSHQTLAVLLQISPYLTMTGFSIVIASLLLYRQELDAFTVRFDFKEWNPWKKRRAYVQFFVYSLIMYHIYLVSSGQSSLPSLCPLTAADLTMSGKFGIASLLYASIFVLTLFLGRFLCGWLCVYTPVMEQSANLLTAMGKTPNRIRTGNNWLIYLFTATFWGGIIYNVAKNWGHLDFRLSNGLPVADHWLFVSGLLTMLPLTMYLTHRFGNRFFCKYVCPLGGLMSLYSRLSFLKVKIDREKCTDCSKCQNACQMGVPIQNYLAEGRAIVNGNCIVCGECIDSCPKRALNFGFGK